MINHDNIFRLVITVILSLLAYIAFGIRAQQTDFSKRLRIVEINQARIMERLGVTEIGKPVSKR